MHGIQGVAGDGEPIIVKETEQVPSIEEDTFILDLSPVVVEGVSSLVVPAATASGAKKRGLKRSLPKTDDDDAYMTLVKHEIERADVQICLAKEQITLTTAD